MRIFDRKHDRLTPRSGHYEGRERGQLPASQFFRRYVQSAFSWQRDVEKRRKQRYVFSRIELDQCQGTFEVSELSLCWDFTAAEPRAAPFGYWVQRGILQKLRTAPFGPGVRHVAQAAVKFLDEAGFAQSRFAHDHHQLPIALSRSLPATHQHGDLFLAAD